MNKKLPADVSLWEAARYITGEHRTDRAEQKFVKFLHYEGRQTRGPLLPKGAASAFVQSYPVM